MKKRLNYITHRGIKVSILELPDTDYFRVTAEHALGTELEAIFKERTGKEVYGLTHLTEHLGFNSPRDYTTLELKTLIRNKGYYNASTWHDEVTYFFESISENYKDVIKAMVNVVNNDLRNVTDEEFTTERSVVYNEIKMYEDKKPDMFNFGVYSIIAGVEENDTVLGNKDVFITLTQEDLINLKSLFLDTPELLTYHIEYDPTKLSIDVILDELYNIHSSFEFKTDNRVDLKDTTIFNKPVLKTDIIVKEADIEQALYHKVISLKDDNNYFLDLLVYKYLLNQPTGHSLYELVRDREGLAYYIRLGSGILRGVRYTQLNTEVSKDKVTLLLDTIKESLSKSRDGVNENVFNDLKKSHLIRNGLDLIDQRNYALYRSLIDYHRHTYDKYEAIISTDISMLNITAMNDITYEDFKLRVFELVDALLDDSKCLIVSNSEDIKK